MTEELKQAAQQALEALEYMHKEKCDYMTRNKLGDPLKEDAARLAIPAMDALRSALTQRPAAQTEREAWVPYLVDRADGVKGHYAIGRWNPRGYREVWNLHSHRWAAYSDDVMSLEEADSLLRQITIPTVRASLPAPQQATPEPVGEPLQGGLDNDALLNAWSSKLPGVTPTDAQMTAFALGVEVGFAHARKLERSDWSRVHDVLKKAGVHPGRTDDHLADVIAKALANRPAPGVPEPSINWFGTHFTYKHQPCDNVTCWRLGEAARNAKPGGDLIDRGLSLLQELEKHGYGIFSLAANAHPATPEPYVDSTPSLSVGESRFESWFSEYDQRHKGTKQQMRDAYAAGMGDPLVTAATPEPVGERWVVVRETSLDVGEGNDVRTGGRPELGYALISDAATFGSEDAAVAAIKSASLPVGWVVLPLSRLLPDLGNTHPAPGVPDGWKLSVSDSDGRKWLHIESPDGAKAALSTAATIDGGRHATIAAQVLDALAAAQAKGGDHG